MAIFKLEGKHHRSSPVRKEEDFAEPIFLRQGPEGGGVPLVAGALDEVTIVERHHCGGVFPAGLQGTNTKKGGRLKRIQNADKPGENFRRTG